MEVPRRRLESLVGDIAAMYSSVGDKAEKKWLTWGERLVQCVGRRLLLAEKGVLDVTLHVVETCKVVSICLKGDPLSVKATPRSSHGKVVDSRAASESTRIEPASVVLLCVATKMR